MSKIYHRINKDVDLVAADFSRSFIVRKFAGAYIHLYATLRTTGHDQQSSFSAAFGSVFFGHPDAIAQAAELFERTPTYRNAASYAIEMLGAERIEKELAARCEEAAHFTQSHAMQFRVEMYDAWLQSRSAANIDHGATRRDDEAYKAFAEERREERERQARADRIGNGIGE
jgi:hypothetical protein